MEEIVRIQIQLFGVTNIWLNGQSFSDFATQKSKALLTYLLYTRQTHRREHLASLLWGDFSQNRASANLRYALNDLRKILGTILHSTRSHVGIDFHANFQADTQYLDDLIQEKTISAEFLDKLETTYIGGFLDQLVLSRAEEFETWKLIEQQKWDKKIHQTLSRFATVAIQTEQYDVGMRAVNWLLELAPLNEFAQRQKLVILANSGNRAGALQYYEAIKQTLFHELSTQPDSRTTRLYNDIRNGTWLPSTISNRVTNNLPALLTPLIGREKEIIELSALIADSQVRLVSVVAMGGMGKTHLSLATAEHNKSIFRDGVYFIELGHLNKGADIVLDLADGIGYQLMADGRSATEQLLTYLQHKDVLLILDGYENLQANNSLLLRILRTAHKLKFLVTSRIRLGVKEEYTYTLKTFEVHEYISLEQVANSPAIQLFARVAKRSNPSFEVTKDNLTGVLKLCKLAGGLPLGLVVVASWLSSLTIDEVLDNFPSALDLHHDFAGSIGYDHEKSIRDIIDFSWAILSGEDQELFINLCVFRTSFSLKAAQHIASARLADLANLLNHSMIQKDSITGRFSIHDLLWEYGYDKLQVPSIYDRIHESYVRYFSDFVKNYENDLIGHGQLQAVRGIRSEFDNIMQAWMYACENLNPSAINAIDQMVLGLLRFIRIEDRWQTGLRLFGKAINQLRESDLLYQSQRFGVLLVAYSNCLFFIGKPMEAIKIASDGFEVAVTKNDLDAELLSFAVTSISQIVVGRVEEASKTIERGAIRAEETGDKYQISRIMLVKSVMARLSHDANTILECARIALPILRASGDRFFVTHMLNQLSFAVAQRGNFEEAITYLIESIDTMRELGSDISLLHMLSGLSYYFFALGNLEEAEAYNQKLLETASQYNMPAYIKTALGLISQIALACGDWDLAYKSGQHSEEITYNYPAYSEVNVGSKHIGLAMWGKGQYQAASIQLTEEIKLYTHDAAPPFRVFALMLSALLLSNKGYLKEASVSIIHLLNHHHTSAFPAWYETSHALWTPFIANLRLQVGEDHFDSMRASEIVVDLETLLATSLELLID